MTSQTGSMECHTGTGTLKLYLPWPDNRQECLRTIPWKHIGYMEVKLHTF